MQGRLKTKQRGAVSIFIVIFTALLVTVVTTSFVQIMLRNQQQASNNDLSQSAYDSALAGVEDAKRALVALKKCQRGIVPDATCDGLQTALENSTDCQILGDNRVNIAVFGDNGEVPVGDASLNQAYTCVKVKVQTDSYTGTLLDANDTVVIPLLPVGASNDVKAIRISWFVKGDLPEVSRDQPTVYPSLVSLPAYASWGSRTPPIMRAQLMQFAKGKAINLADFDGAAAQTRFLYPLRQEPAKPLKSDTFNLGARRTGAGSMTSGGCRTNFDDYGGYACSVELALPDMPAGDNREAYLQLASIYTRATVGYKVELLNNVGSTGVIQFDNVQPEVDSTGRASDQFRRVKARVTVSPSGAPLPFPEAPVTTKDLCKEFFITNSPTDYNGNANGDSTTCTPS